MSKNDWAFVLTLLLLADVGVIVTAILYPKVLAYAVAGLFTFGTLCAAVATHRKLTGEEDEDEDTGEEEA